MGIRIYPSFHRHHTGVRLIERRRRMKKKVSEQERKALQAKLSDLEELYAAGYRYAARNQSGELRTYKRKPYKEINFWFSYGYGSGYAITIRHDMFDMLNWNDQEPAYIKKEIESIKKQLEDSLNE